MTDCCSNAQQDIKPSALRVQCCCQQSAPTYPPNATKSINRVRYFGIGAAALALWCGVYSLIIPFSRWITYNLLSLAKGTGLGDSVEFFFYDTAKILLLLGLMVYGIRTYIQTAERAGQPCCADWAVPSRRSRNG